jgi:Uma2 family endonuclease
MITLTENPTLAPLLDSPRLALYAQEMQRVLSQEADRRCAFYEELREDEKAEFINGEKIVHSPVKFRHGAAVGHLYRLLSSYVLAHDLGWVGVEKILISLTRNDYEPDICFFRTEQAAGFTPDQMRFPAPDFVVEVLSESTEANDRGVKFDDYAAHGIGEYWIVDPESEVVEQYQLAGDHYALAIKAQTGELRSLAVPGFTIPVRAIFDDALNRATLRQILSG